MESVQFAAIDHIKDVVEKSKKEGVDVDKKALFLIDKCRYGDIYGRITWSKLLHNIKKAQDIEFYYGLFNN